MKMKSTRKINKNNTIRYYRKGRLHREGGPAVIYADGFTFWYRHGENYNPVGPVEITEDGEVVYRNLAIEVTGDVTYL